MERPGNGGKEEAAEEKKKPSACKLDCAGENCGDSDGCSGFCTACPSGQTCQNRPCVDDSCNPPCTGNHLCQNGICVCPRGLKEGDGPGYFGNCHECCVDQINTLPDEECQGSPGGEYYLDDDGDHVFRCGCFSGLVSCDGQCGECCGDGFCQTTQGPGRYCNANLACDCPQDTTHCSDELGCRDTLTDRNACGPTCVDCGAGGECQNGSCCIGLANDCATNFSSCCSGLQCVNIGDFWNPEYVCG